MYGARPNPLDQATSNLEVGFAGVRGQISR